MRPFLFIPTVFAAVLCVAVAVCVAAPSDDCNTIVARRDRLRARLDACEARLPACAREIECRRSRSSTDACVDAYFVCERAAESSKTCGGAYTAWREAWAEWLGECEGK